MFIPLLFALCTAINAVAYLGPSASQKNNLVCKIPLPVISAGDNSPTLIACPDINYMLITYDYCSKIIVVDINDKLCHQMTLPRMGTVHYLGKGYIYVNLFPLGGHKPQGYIYNLLNNKKTVTIKGRYVYSRYGYNYLVVRNYNDVVLYNHNTGQSVTIKAVEHGLVICDAIANNKYALLMGKINKPDKVNDNKQISQLKKGVYVEMWDIASKKLLYVGRAYQPGSIGWHYLAFISNDVIAYISQPNLWKVVNVKTKQLLYTIGSGRSDVHPKNLNDADILSNEESISDTGRLVWIEPKISFGQMQIFIHCSNVRTGKDITSINIKPMQNAIEKMLKIKNTWVLFCVLNELDSSELAFSITPYRVNDFAMSKHSATGLWAKGWSGNFALYNDRYAIAKSGYLQIYSLSPVLDFPLRNANPTSDK